MIEIVELEKALDGVPVLRGVNLRVPTGMTTAIIGSSGAGKTVLLKHLIGLLKPDAGKIYIDGVDTATLSDREWKELRKEKFGMLFQEGALFDSMNVYQNVSFFLVEHTSLSPDSGGMKRRVALARAIVADPKIVLFDEPTVGLDPIICSSILRLIKETQQRLGITFVIVTHNILAGFSVAQKIAMLHNGKIVATGTPEQMRQSENPVVQEFLKGVQLSSV